MLKITSCFSFIFSSFTYHYHWHFYHHCSQYHQNHLMGPGSDVTRWILDSGGSGFLISETLLDIVMQWSKLSENLVVQMFSKHNITIRCKENSLKFWRNRHEIPKQNKSSWWLHLLAKKETVINWFLLNRICSYFIKEAKFVDQIKIRQLQIK